MTALIAFIAIVNAVSQSDLQGTWQGTGRHANYSLLFCEDILAGRVGTNPILEPMESHFSASQKQGTIDIQRDDGLQLGRYAIEGDTLTLMLADVNLPRPESIVYPIVKLAGLPVVIDRTTRRLPTQQRYVFDRAR